MREDHQGLPSYRVSVHLGLVPEFSPGLEGVVAAETAVSEVDGANGRLIYRGGYLIEDLAPVATYEEVAYLLWHGELPSKAQLDALRHQMALARKLNDSACGALLATDPATTPMDILRTVVSAQGSSKTLTKPTLDEAIALTSIFPTIVAAAHRRSQGKDIVKPREDLGHAANLLWMMDGKEPNADRVRWLETYLVLLADHGLNASTFTARVIASTGSDLTSAVVGAIGALKGPAHGGATFAVRVMLDKLGSAYIGLTTRERRYFESSRRSRRPSCTARQREPKSWRSRSFMKLTPSGL